MTNYLFFLVPTFKDTFVKKKWLRSSANVMFPSGHVL